MLDQQKQNVKYRLIAYITHLHISKNITFQTKITWKRNVNKAETETVTHVNGESVFNESLQLQLNLAYNLVENRFEPKYTEFSIVVIYQGKIKSGGYVKYDAAQIVNKNFADETVRLNLVQCPDPEAYLQVVFNYQVIGESSRSLFNELSMLNPSGMEQDLSQIDFNQNQYQNTSIEGSQKQSITSMKNSMTSMKESMTEREIKASYNGKQLQMNKMNDILDKFDILSRKIKPNQKSLFQDQNSTKNESLQLSAIPTQQQQRLRYRVNELQRQLQNREALLQEYQSKIEQQSRQIQQLNIKLEMTENKQIEQFSRSADSKTLQLIAIVQRQNNLKCLYQKTLSELQQMKANVGIDMNFSKQSMGFNKFLEEVNEVDEIPEFINDRQQDKQNDSNNSQKIQLLQRENVELQTKIASLSHNIAQLFNAALDYGKEQLLDFLQRSIGLIEHNE